MRIESISARNFLTFGEQEVVFRPRPGLTTVVGPNGAGKTNLLRAVDFVISALERPQQVDAYRHRGTGDPELELCVSVVFGPEEARTLGQFVALSAWNRNFNPVIGSGFENQTDQAEATRLSNLFISKLEPLFERIFSGSVRFRVVGTADSTAPTDAWIEVETSKGTLYLRNNAGGMTFSAGPLMGWTGVDLRNLTLQTATKMFPGALRFGSEARRLTEAETREVSETFTVDWLLDDLASSVPNPRMLQLEPIDARIQSARTAGFPEVARAFFSELYRRGWYEPGISLRDLLSLVFRSSVVRLSNWRAPPELKAPPEFHQIPTKYGRVTGAELPSALWRLRDSADLFDRERFDLVRGAYESVFPEDSLEVILETHQLPFEESASPVVVQQNQLVVAPSATATRYYQLPVLRFRSGSLEVPVENLSAGKFEVLLVLFAAFGNAGSVLFLDEPATNLHPPLQRSLAQYLSRQARDGKLQIIIVTHSPAFVDPHALRGLVRIDRPGGSSRVLSLDTGAGLDLSELTREVLKRRSLIPMLFARKVILFEGEQEARSLPVWFRKIDPTFDPADMGVEAVDAEGDSNLLKYAQALARLEIPFAIVGDRQNKDQIAPLTPHQFLVGFDDFGDLVKAECGAQLELLRPRSGGAPWEGKVRADLCHEVAEGSDPPPSVRRLWSQIVEFVKAA